MSILLQKQGVQILRSNYYSYFLVAAFAIIPFANWLSLAVILLVALRKGLVEGGKMLLLGLGIILAIAAYNGNHLLPLDIPGVLATYIIGFIAALGLHRSLSLTTVIAFLLAVAMLVMTLVQSLAPDLLMQQWDLSLKIFKVALDQANQPLPPLLELLDADSRYVLANYLLGVQMVSIILSALSSLFMARYVQGLIYYPGGFRQELLAFKASKVAVIILIIASLGSYLHYPLAINCLPMFLVYISAAGMVVMFRLIAKKKGWLRFIR